ncbi:MAG: glutamate formimidoyltransferase [Chloroflexi bacterium]|nr:glutamate formimidoyltransferase [Chloroflexota bacterium]
MPIIECIPNFSEARRPEVMDAIRQTIAAVQGVHVLDQHSDMDHNRSVITFAGTPQGVEEAAFRIIARAAQLINLDEHRGAHPRIGATDVVPFVPIRDATMQECAEMARRVGQRVGAELHIPVYLYEEAAARPERKNLENLRRGQYEGLKIEIETNPERAPDFGPARLGSAGATVIGARHPLVAFNAYLTTHDVEIAKKIAKAVRHSSGGLRYVKALGLLVDGRAQVSMNLTNFRETPVARVVEMIRREAARYGAGVHHTELVGLIPEAALVDAAVWHLQLDQFEPGQILERRLQEGLAASGEQGAGGERRFAFLDELASAAPTPGGGSASAYAGAAAAALTAMVARLTVGRKKYAAVEAQMRQTLEQAERLRASLTAAVDEDAAAFQQVMAAFKLPKETSEQAQTRAAAIEQATLRAAQVPLEIARQAAAVMELAVFAVSEGNLNAISDGAVAVTQARAALTGAGYNVRINAATLQDRQAAQTLLDEVRGLEKKAAALENEARLALSERGDLSLS